jgi:hypothetical protein
MQRKFEKPVHGITGNEKYQFTLKKKVPGYLFRIFFVFYFNLILNLVAPLQFIHQF